MLKIIIYVVLAYFVYRIFKNLFGKSKVIEKGERGGVIDEMVQDPICKTYIPRRDSQKRVIGGNEYFFCSNECASKFELENKE
jgi:YHS domain-containing protein